MLFETLLSFRIAFGVDCHPCNRPPQIPPMIFWPASPSSSRCFLLGASNTCSSGHNLRSDHHSTCLFDACLIACLIAQHVSWRRYHVNDAGPRPRPLALQALLQQPAPSRSPRNGFGKGFSYRTWPVPSWSLGTHTSHIATSPHLDLMDGLFDLIGLFRRPWLGGRTTWDGGPFLNKLNSSGASIYILDWLVSFADGHTISCGLGSLKFFIFI